MTSRERAEALWETIVKVCGSMGIGSDMENLYDPITAALDAHAREAIRLAERDRSLKMRQRIEEAVEAEQQRLRDVVNSVVLIAPDPDPVKNWHGIKAMLLTAIRARSEEG